MSGVSLASALGVAAGEVVAFVGAGGKTSAMFRVAAEVVAAGGHVVTTTTTRLAASDARHAPVHVQRAEELGGALAAARHVLLTAGLDAAAGKLIGLAPAALCALRRRDLTLLVEADGSRRLPFKAPAAHEPVVPPCATLVVWVVGVDALGQPLDDAHVHRPERVARIHPGALVTPAMVAAVAADPAGGCKRVPREARVALLINKVDDDDRRARARAVAARTAPGGRIARVVLAALARPGDAVIEVISKEVAQ